MNRYEYAGQDKDDDLIFTVWPKNHNVYSGEPRDCVARGFQTIVLGGRGAYVEFLPEQMAMENIFIPTKELWRLTSSVAFYVEFRTRGGTKIYLQRRPVDYAPYVIGRFYISPRELYYFGVCGTYVYG